MYGPSQGAMGVLGGDCGHERVLAHLTRPCKRCPSRRSGGRWSRPAGRRQLHLMFLARIRSHCRTGPLRAAGGGVRVRRARWRVPGGWSGVRRGVERTCGCSAQSWGADQHTGVGGGACAAAGVDPNDPGLGWVPSSPTATSAWAMGPVDDAAPWTLPRRLCRCPQILRELRLCFLPAASAAHQLWA
jgi:hypothetical protein